jgi:hypothetical protein
MKFIAPALATLAVATVAIPASAHHSYAMFDRTRSTTVEGTIKKFQWTNPHSWIYVTVTDKGGQALDWPVEAGAPAGLSRQGWTPKTLVPGMKVKMTMHPLADGKPGGQFMTVTLPDGKKLGEGDQRPAD